MQGYVESSYGDAFADVYDEWYAGVSDVEATVGFLAARAVDGAPVLELGVGTGRLAIPLALALSARGTAVLGVDASPAMLAVLAANDPQGSVATTHGDMVAAMPDGPFGLVFVAYNTLFNLPSEQRQGDAFGAIAARLAPGAAFVVEAFVPDDLADERGSVGVHSITADRVVLNVSRADASAQTAEGQFVEITERGGVRLRPWSIRYTTPAQLDTLAARCGLLLSERFESFAGEPFTTRSPRHVSVYRAAG